MELHFHQNGIRFNLGKIHVFNDFGTFHVCIKCIDHTQTHSTNGWFVVSTCCLLLDNDLQIYLHYVVNY